MKHKPWVLRAAAAGLLACFAGSSIGWLSYYFGPNAHRVDWCASTIGLAGLALLVAFGFCIPLAGVTLRAVERRTTRYVSAWRIIGAGALGGAVGGLIPATVGMGGFGAVDAPYVGTAWIILSSVVMGTVFVALWAPRLSELPAEQRPGLAKRFGFAAIAAVITAATISTLVWVGAGALGLIPDLSDIRELVHAIGYIPAMMVAAVGVSAATGAYIGMASWVYLSLELASARRR